MIRSLAAAVPENGSVTFFGDMAQQIYGQRMSWRSAGLRPEKVWEFAENYRNSREIARLALAIADMPFFSDIPDLVEPKEPTAAGPKPVIALCKSRDAEIALGAARARDLGTTSSVAILYRKREIEGTLRRMVPKGAVRLHRDLERWISGPGVYYGTLHSAKGLEFDNVIILHCNDSDLPDPDARASRGDDEAARSDAKLLYVGVTRARTSLVMTRSEELTSLLPNPAENVDLYSLVRA
jgi:superfamily I DNA/RNA helicase